MLVVVVLVLVLLLLLLLLMVPMSMSMSMLMLMLMLLSWWLLLFVRRAVRKRMERFRKAFGELAGSFGSTWRSSAKLLESVRRATG
eukprot:7583851-Alexandrium_andersonii.AAC.1